MQWCRQDAFVKGLIKSPVLAEKAKTTLKRKVGYLEEEISVTRAKIAQMEIDEDGDKSSEGMNKLD